MRMLQLPNAAVQPQSWVPRMRASYATFQLQIDSAFDNVGPLFDAMQDHEDAWKNTLEGWETDPYGPQVDVRKEFIANMGRRITLVTDYDMPITDDSERSLFAIEATARARAGQDAGEMDDQGIERRAARGGPVRDLGARAEGRSKR